MPVFMDFIIYPRNKDKQFFIVSEAMNYQMFKDFKADYVVMKDSGKEGGTIEKIKACKSLGITPVVIGRQGIDAGFESIEELLKYLT